MANSDSSSRFSSDYLYHFKKDHNILKLILRYGLRHNSWPESLPFLQASPHLFTQNTFVVCFCDLRPQDSASHRECYGSNAIVLRKEWGVANNVSPVRYIHHTSPGATPDYFELKSMYRSARIAIGNRPDKMLLMYLVHCMLRATNDLVQGDLQTTVTLDPDTRAKAQAAQQRIKRALTDAGTLEVNAEVTDLLELLMERIHQLHNELEKRDAYMRAYKEDFTSPATGRLIKEKVLYDEHEWRSVQFIDLSDVLSQPKKYAFAVANGHLPREYNLTFGDNDVYAILAEDGTVQEDLMQLIESGETLLSRTMSSKVFIAHTFAE